MRIAMLKRAVNRLAVVASSNGPCPACADWHRPLLLRDAEQEPDCCSACGRRPRMVRLVRVGDFYAGTSSAVQQKEL
jgi:hypothetical protein